MELPEFGKPDDVSETIKERAKTLCPWLPDPFTCPECQSYCDATVAYDPHMVDYVDAWECRECGSKYYREGY